MNWIIFVNLNTPYTNIEKLFMEINNFHLLFFFFCKKTQESKLKSRVRSFRLISSSSPHLGNRLQLYQSHMSLSAFWHNNVSLPLFPKSRYMCYATNFISFLMNHAFCTIPWLRFYIIRMELLFDLFFKLCSSTVLCKENMGLWR